MTTQTAIEVAALSKRVHAAGEVLDILQDINFTVPAGASLAIVGRSGSGKSTLLGLLAGLDVVSSGSVRIEGVDLANLNEDGRARLRSERIGFVFQSFQLLPNLTALENVMMPLELSGRRADNAAARALLERVGLGERLHHYPRTLSGGEQQRVGLARAFVVEPALLFADEPTGSLDSATGQRVAELMFALQRERQTTLVLVTHDEQLAARCDARLHLEAGRLLEPAL